VGEVVLFAILFVLGCVFLYNFLGTWFLPTWRVNHAFVEHTCTVRDKRISEKTEGQLTQYLPEVRIEYQVGATSYATWAYALPNSYYANKEEVQEIVGRFQADHEYPCWYDPDNPQVAVLVRGYVWWTSLWLIVPATFITLGGGGLIFSLLHFGTSAERRSALVRRAGRMELFDRPGLPEGEFPFVPDAAAVTDSPGTTLAFRLPIRTSAAWFVFWLGVACVGWNVVVLFFVRAAVASFQAGDVHLGPVLGLVPFVLIGLWLVGYFIYRLLIAHGIGPTLVEISAHPLLAGATYELLVSQSGRLRMKSLDVLLVSEEEATYRQGTDLRVEKRRVYEQPLFHQENLEIHRGTPLEIRCPLQIPAKAMHSFKAEHNEIGWKLVVQGNPAGWPRYQREFPLIVYPGGGDGHASNGSGPS
jgi:hypothetical protein